MTRILLIAEACNPEWSSVPLVGYNMARALAERPELQVTIATSVRNREALLADPLADAAEIEYLDTERIAGPAYRLGKLLRGGRGLGWTTAMAFNWPGYVSFEKKLAQRFGPALRGGQFDLLHRLTPLSPTLPSAIAGRFDVPFLLGPLNGGLPWPKEHPQLRGREREWLVPLRGLARKLPYWRSTFRHAAGVITASRHTATEIPSDFTGRHFRLPENGIDPGRFPIARDWTPPPTASPWQFVTVGRLVPYKGIDLAIEALALLRDESRLVVIGDGPMRGELEALAEQRGVGERVDFRGWLPQQTVSHIVRDSQAFVFPSLREFGGGVALEAMASAVPSVIVDYGGPAELVRNDCGIRVPMAGRDELIETVAAAMRYLRDRPEEAAAMGRAAAERVTREHTWEAKAEKVVGFYGELLQRPLALRRAG